MEQSTRTTPLRVFGDFALLAILILGVTSPFHGRGDWEVNWLVILIATGMGVTFFFRRTVPLIVLTITVGLSIVLIAVGVAGPVITLPFAISIFSVAFYLRKRTAWIATSSAAFLLTAVYIALPNFDFFDPNWIAFLAVPAFAAATGFYGRSKRDLLDALEARAAAAEATRETVAKTRVAEERLRIAQDLHDVIGHQIAAIGLHADLAERAIDRDRGQALRSLAVIKNSARQGLGEIADMMKVLRGSSEQLTSPTLANLDDLLKRYRDSGLDIEFDAQGGFDGLPPALDAVAYRAVQEGLTNVAKHSLDHSARLKLSREPAQLLIELSNHSAQTSSHLGGGFGLIGIRERVATVGGTVELSETVGGPQDSPSQFTLSVVIPLRSGGVN